MSDENNSEDNLEDYLEYLARVTPTTMPEWID